MIGTRTYRYDIFGGDVLAASEMESHGVPGGVVVSAATKEALEGIAATPFAIPGLSFLPHGNVEVKGVGNLDAWVVQLDGIPLAKG